MVVSKVVCFATIVLCYVQLLNIAGAQPVHPRFRIVHDAEAGNVNGTIVPVSGFGSVRVQNTADGGWDGTLNYEATVDGTNWDTVQCTDTSDGALVTTTAAMANTVLCNVNGVQRFRVRISDRTVGTTTVAVLGVEQVSGGSSLNLLTGGSDGDSSTTQSDSGLELLNGQLTLIRGCGDNQIPKWDEVEDDWNCENDATGAGGQAVVLDLGDDGANESTDLGEIATTGDTNSIFTEPSADKLLIAVGNNWPTADTAVALSADGANCAAGQYPLGVDASGAVQGCTADDDQPDSDAEVPDAITVAGGAVNTSAITLDTGADPTADGQIRWDTATERIEVGDDGVATLEFYPGTHTTDTGPSPDCVGSTTYQDGEGMCDTLHVGTDITADLEEETHVAEHQENGADELLGEAMGTACTDGQVLKANATGGLDCGTDETGAGGGDPVLIDGVEVTDSAGVDLIGGTNGIDIAFNSAVSPDTATFDFDPTEVGAATWLDNADRAWTFDIAAAGTNPVISFSSNTINVSTGNLQEGGSNVLTVADQNAGTDVTADLEEETHAAEHASAGGDAVDHDTLTNFVANEHVDHSTVSINTASPALTGGGDITTTRTLDLDYTSTLAGNPALGTDECVFSTDGVGGGILCEGAADLIEGLLVWNPSTADRTLTLPDATDILVGRDTSDTLTNKTLAAADNTIEADTGDSASAFFAVGQIEAARGGTGDDTSATTGVPRIDAGNWSYAELSGDVVTSGSNVTVIQANSVALGTDTTGGYAASTTEGGGAAGLEADGLDAMTEIATAIKRRGDDVDAYLLTTSLAIPAANRCLEVDTNGSVVVASDACANLGPGGTTAIDALADVGAGDDAIALAEQGQTWTWNSAAAAAAYDGLTLAVDHDATTDANTQNLLVVERNNTVTGALTWETLLQINNNDVDGAVTNGLAMTAAAGSITNAVNLNDAQITNAFVTPNATISMSELEFLDGGTRTDEALCTYEVTGNQLECDVSTKALLEAALVDVADFAEADGDIYIGVHDFGGAGSLEVPNGANPTVDATAEVAVDTTDGQLLYHNGTAVQVVGTERSKSMVIETPADADNFLFFRTERAITIQGIDCLVNAATSVIITVQECDANGGTCTATEAAMTCATTNTTESGAIDDPAVDAGDWMRIDVGAVSGTPGHVNVTVRFTETRT